MKTSFILRELVVHQQKHVETSSKRVHRSALVKKKKWKHGAGSGAVMAPPLCSVTTF